jgi:hypothetical protein
VERQARADTCTGRVRRAPVRQARCSRTAPPSTHATRVPRARRGCTRRWGKARRRTAWAAPGRARATRTPPTACSWTATSWLCALLPDRLGPPANAGPLSVGYSRPCGGQLAEALSHRLRSHCHPPAMQSLSALVTWSRAVAACRGALTPLAQPLLPRLAQHHPAHPALESPPVCFPGARPDILDAGKGRTHYSVYHNMGRRVP